MNKTKAAMSAVRTKAKTKPTEAKPAKKRSKTLAAALSSKPVKKRSAAAKTRAVAVRTPSDIKPTVVPLAEIEVLAAKAEKTIKAARNLSAADKAWRLEDVARSLKNARGWGGLSKCGASGLAHIHEPVRPYDMRAVMR
ncbi:hypothetical protein R80B4_02289 [Fibrobacteres bacterium R8-0-B4]